ncbi:MAG: hypothetical protein U5K81_08380 [Trueperaceae bacterium]|nr:hypothetical protein [Trueperaceae bacterium]
MKRLALSSLLVAGVLAACAPQATVMNNVVPSLISVQLPQDDGEPIRLDGRYFGDGQDGQADDSYVVIGARGDCTGGVELQADTWSANRITFRDPGGVGSGFVCVVANGVTSNGLPLDLN